MKMARYLPFLAGLAAAHPMQNVIDELEKLRVKAQEEGEQGGHDQDQYERWCTNEISKHKSNIKDNNETIEELKTSISGLSKQIEGLEEAID